MKYKNLFKKEFLERGVTSTGVQESFRAVTEQARYPIGNIIQIFEKQIIQPEYQRNFVWNKRQQSMLIESILLNIPLPPIFLYESNFFEYEVVDGQQRLTAVINFLNNELTLTGLTVLSRYNGQKFKDFDSELQHVFKRSYISATILLRESAKNQEEALQLKQFIFERLNTSGEKLKNQELRNAIFIGPFNALLHELAKKTELKKLMNIKEQSANRFFDVELILRFYAYFCAYENRIVGENRQLLDIFMRNSMNFTHDEIRQLECLFIETLDRVVKYFEEDAFFDEEKKKSSKMLYDSIMLAVAKHVSESETIISKSLRVEKNEMLKEHSDVFNPRNTSLSNVFERADLILELISQ